MGMNPPLITITPANPRLIVLMLLACICCASQQFHVRVRKRWDKQWKLNCTITFTEQDDRWNYRKWMLEGHRKELDTFYVTKIFCNNIMLAKGYEKDAESDMPGVLLTRGATGGRWYFFKNTPCDIYIYPDPNYIDDFRKFLATIVKGMPVKHIDPELEKLTFGDVPLSPHRRRLSLSPPFRKLIDE